MQASGKNQFGAIYYGCSNEDCSANISCKSVVTGCRFATSTNRMSGTLALPGRLYCTNARRIEVTAGGNVGEIDFLFNTSRPGCGGAVVGQFARRSQYSSAKSPPAWEGPCIISGKPGKTAPPRRLGDAEYLTATVGFYHASDFSMVNCANHGHRINNLWRSE